MSLVFDSSVLVWNMTFFKKFFAPKEIRAALGVLDELESRFDCDAFRIVRQSVEQMILARSQEFVEVIRKGTPARKWILGAVSNFSGDHAESGQYHLHRGVLNPLGPGEDFIKIYDGTIDESVKMGFLEKEFAEKQKAALRQNIEDVG